MIIVALGVLSSPLYTLNNYTVLICQFHLFWWMLAVSFFVVLAFQVPTENSKSEATSKKTIMKDVECGRKV